MMGVKRVRKRGKEVVEERQGWRLSERDGMVVIRTKQRERRAKERKK